MTKILVATDFSESCTHALEYTKKIFVDKQVEIHLIHVYDMPLIFTGAGGIEPNAFILPKIEKDKEEELAKVFNTIPVSQRGDAVLKYNALTATEIYDYSVKMDADIIIMGMRQKYSLIDRLIGTISSNVIKKSAIPVLVIPNQCSIKSISTVLFPTLQHISKEINEEQKSIIEFLQTLLEPSKGNIHFLRITEEETIDIHHHINNYPDIEFIVSHSESLEKGINDVTFKLNPDILAIEKRNHSFWENLYRSDIIRKVLYKTRLPLLIM